LTGRRPQALVNARGFSMTEIIVVVAIIGIIMAVSAPTLWTYFRTAALRAGAEELVTVLNGARQLAMRLNRTVCVVHDGTSVQYRLGGCAAPPATIWAGPGTDAAGNIRLANGIQTGGTNNLCYGYLGAGAFTPAPCVNNAVFTVTNPNGGATMNVVVATSGRARIQ
jgi:prepilin-type N-terminal cleavage/methylation domain-containing protein